MRFDVFCWILFWIKTTWKKRVRFVKFPKDPHWWMATTSTFRVSVKFAEGEPTKLASIWSSLISDINHGNHLEPMDETTETTEKIEGCDAKHVLYMFQGSWWWCWINCYIQFVLLQWFCQHRKKSLNSGQPFFVWDARIDLGKIYNATDIEIYFGWRAQVRIDSIDSPDCRLSAKFRSLESMDYG